MATKPPGPAPLFIVGLVTSTYCCTESHLPLKILCLDGGGVRGYSSAIIVEHIIEAVGFKRNGGKRPEVFPTVFDLFDLVCGTSTGGLLAIMLGRLKMVGITILSRWSF